MAAATSVVIADAAASPQQFPNVFSRVWRVKAVLDSASVATGAAGTGTDTVTVPGVALGDVVLALSAGVSLAGLSRTAYVSAADTVTIVSNNLTGGAVDLASTGISLVVARFAFP